MQRKLLFLRGVVEEECGWKDVWDNEGTGLDVLD